MMKQQVFNPYLPSYEYIPDGEPHVFGDRVYIYGSHDRFDGTTFCMNDYVCWSAPKDDLSDWRYEGVIWERTKDPHYKKGQNMYAPDVCQGPDGKYYLYYGMSTGLTRKTWTIRAAVADTPTGPYEYHGEVDLYPWSKQFLPFDPAVYVEDGRVWLYYGSAMFYPMLDVSRRHLKGGAVVELDGKDMLTVIAPPKVTVPMKSKDNVYGDHAFFEASSVRKIRGTYYFIYSSLLGHELCYATSDAPDGAWKFGGTIVSIGDIGLGKHTDVKSASNYTGNTHGSILDVDGEYYIFYHRQTNRHCFSRQGCAEKITILADGSIPQVETTSCGLNGKPLAGKGTYEARIACNLTSKKGCRFQGGLFKASKGKYPYFTQSGVDRMDSPDQYVANLSDGCLVGFKYFSLENTAGISVKVRGTGCGKFKIYIADGAEAEGAVSVSAESDWQEFSAKIPFPNGVYPLYFQYEGTGKIDFDSFTLL